MHNVKCLKCSKVYKDSDPDDYYCPECLAERNKIADKIDRQFANRPKTEIKTPLQQYDIIKGDGKFISFNDFNNLSI